MNQEGANKYVEDAIDDLINRFIKTPTIFLEEKHLHNEFDRILRDVMTKEKETITKNVRGREGDDCLIPFPILMNEYATVNKYKASDNYEETYNEPGKNGHTGSLDYVIINPEWLENDAVTYNVAVNKNETTRNLARNDESLPNRFLVTVEFKFLHYAEKYISWDRVNHEGQPNARSMNSAVNTIKCEMEKDINKQLHENPAYAFVVYFNSKINLNEDSINQLKGYIENYIQANNHSCSLVVRYVQAGVPWRFDNLNRQFSIPDE